MQKSLSARLLILTIVFVMLAEVLIFLPSVARYRTTWLAERLGAAHVAILTLEAAPDAMVSEELERQLLDFVGAEAIALRRDGARVALLNDMPPAVDRSYELSQEGPVDMIGRALSALVSDGEGVIRVVGPSPKDPAVDIELVLTEGPLCSAIIGFAGRILMLSLVISMVTAGLVFLVLRWQFVRPMRRLTGRMVRFREAPDDASRIVEPSARRDELGVAERELAVMQQALHDTLTQRRHLAALGAAVAKIQHDLRGVLSTALVVSDRLESSADPEVQRVTPTLVASIERAVKLASETLHYVGRDQPSRRPETVRLAEAVEEAGQGLANGALLDNRTGAGVQVYADRDQLYRMLNNLLRNAAEAGATRITVTARPVSASAPDDAATVALDVADDGPGLAPRAQEKLFQPFEGSARAGGTGLGLAIARELAHSNGGDLTLVASGADGARFRLILPVEARNA
ncbi:MAG: HAMP domain-containing sensor histidine kinase [Marivibrio sp.]|uniref:sensor histidine kinase n=1 Tax=Marivibrio sp. TaxID=2039719 RepID=UPI0032EBC26B